MLKVPLAVGSRKNDMLEKYRIMSERSTSRRRFVKTGSRRKCSEFVRWPDSKNLAVLF